MNNNLSSKAESLYFLPCPRAHFLSLWDNCFSSVFAHNGLGFIQNSVNHSPVYLIRPFCYRLIFQYTSLPFRDSMPFYFNYALGLFIKNSIKFCETPADNCLRYRKNVKDLTSRSENSCV